jgi:uncharacterized protein (TIGR00725 family)
MNIDYDIFTGEKVIVEIDMRSDKEQGKIPMCKNILIPDEVNPEIVIISTISNEFELKTIGKFNCLDIQGYVRDNTSFGTKKFFDSIELEKFDIIKGTVEEITYIPKMRLKNVPLVLITDGSNGFKIYISDKEYQFTVEKIFVPDTIGAGDTFFTAFCIKYYETKDIFQSAEYAQMIVTEFLMKKIIRENKETKMKKLQIGVMGSAADLKYSKQLEEIAEKVGELIAKSDNITVYGAEKDYDSLSTAAARGAKKANGLTVGVTYGKGKAVYDQEFTDVIIATGIDRGGGREFVLVNSCDAIIAISGGSGTLTEIAIAYQSNIPIICLQGVGGWSEKLAGTFLDDRKRLKCIEAKTPEEAVAKALEELKNNQK